MTFPAGTIGFPAAPPSPLRRMLAGAAGVVLVLFTLGMTLGVAAGAFIGIGVAWLLMRRRKGPLTRKGAAIGAAIGGISGFAAVFVAIMLLLPPGSMESIQRNAAAAARAQRDSGTTNAPDWATAASPEAAKAAQEQAVALTESPGFMAASLSAGAAFTVLLMGALSALGAWGATMFVGYAVRGHTLVSSDKVDPTLDAAAV